VPHRKAVIIAAEPNPRYPTSFGDGFMSGLRWPARARRPGDRAGSAGQRSRAAPCGSEVTAEDRAGGYYLSDPGDVLAGLPVTPNRSAR